VIITNVYTIFLLYHFTFSVAMGLQHNNINSIQIKQSASITRRSQYLRAK